MKIKKIQAFAIKSDMAGGKAMTARRRPSWLDAAEVAGPMSRFARYRPRIAEMTGLRRVVACATMLACVAVVGGGAAAVGLALVNTIGALAGFVAPNYRLWADVTFGVGAGLYALGLTTVLGAIMIASTAIVLRPKTSSHVKTA